MNGRPAYAKLTRQRRQGQLLVLRLQVMQGAPLSIQEHDNQ